MKKNVLFIISAVFTLIFLLYVTVRESEISDIHVAIPRGFAASPFLIARDQGFFEKQGLNVILHKSDPSSGLGGLWQEGVQYSFVSSSQIVKESLVREDFKILSQSVLRNEDFSLVFRDNSLRYPLLHGSRTGTTKEHYSSLKLYLLLAGYSSELDDIAVDSEERLYDSLASGELDMLYLPSPGMGARRINGVLLDTLDIPGEYYSLVARDDTLLNNDGTVVSLLKALCHSFEYIKTKRDRGLVSLMDSFKEVSEEDLQRLWEGLFFENSVDISFLYTLQVLITPFSDQLSGELFSLSFLKESCGGRISLPFMDSSGINIAYSSDPLYAPLIIAGRKGFFQEEDIPVRLLSYSSDAEALEALKRGEAHVAAVSGDELVKAVEEGHDLDIITVLGQNFQHVVLMVRRDSDIRSVHDIKGRTIGTTQCSEVEIFLNSFFKHNNILKEEVFFKELHREEMFRALQKKNVDGVALCQPYAAGLLRSLGGDVIVIPYTGKNSVISYLVMNRNGGEEEKVQKILKAVVSSGRFIHEEREEAITLTAQYLGMNEAVLRLIWGNYLFHPHIDDSFFMNLKERVLGTEDVSEFRGIPEEAFPESGEEQER